jgi:SnoaL-like domain
MMGTEFDVTNVVKELAAKQAITEVIYRYCRALDRMDRELAATLWHTDGTTDFGSGVFQGLGSEFIDWVWKMHEPLLAHTHCIHNILIQLDGDRAVSESYVVTNLWGKVLPEGMVPVATEMIVRGRYLDRWSCRDGVWAIDHRRFVADYNVAGSVHGTPLFEAGSAEARRDRSDPSYEAFGQLAKLGS